MSQKLQEPGEYMSFFLHFRAYIVTYVKSHYSPSLIISSNIPCKAGLGEHFFTELPRRGLFGNPIPRNWMFTRPAGHFPGWFSGKRAISTQDVVVVNIYATYSYGRLHRNRCTSCAN